MPEPYTIPDSKSSVWVGYSWPETVWINTIPYHGISFLTQEYHGGLRANTELLPGLQIRLKNHHLPENAALFEKQPPGIDVVPSTYPGQESPVIFHLRNKGTEEVSSIDYSVIIGDKEESRHLDVSVRSGTDQVKDVAIPIKGITEPGPYTVGLRVDKVNGKENVLKDKVTYYSLQNLNSKVESHVVMEVATSPQSDPDFKSNAMAMDLAKKAYGDRFIGIAVHWSGPLGVGRQFGYNYDLGHDYHALINRNYITYDPAMGYFNAYYDTFAPTAKVNMLEEALKVVPSVDLKVKGEWNADKTQVNATCDVEILTDDERWKNSVFFVLVADGVEAEDGSEYNDVMIGSAYGHKSVEGLSSNVKAGEKRTYVGEISFEKPDAVEDYVDKNKVYLVAIACRTSFSPIINAAKVKVEECSVPDGISTVNAPVANSDVYTLSGQLVRRGSRSVGSLPRGLYIINGRKVAVIH